MIREMTRGMKKSKQVKSQWTPGSITWPIYPIFNIIAIFLQNPKQPPLPTFQCLPSGITFRKTLWTDLEKSQVLILATKMTHFPPFWSWLKFSFKIKNFHFYPLFKRTFGARILVWVPKKMSPKNQATLYSKASFLSNS